MRKRIIWIIAGTIALLLAVVFWQLDIFSWLMLDL